jgi:hypothetical protein
MDRDNNRGKSTMSNDTRRARRPIAILIGLEAATLAVMSALHLTGILAGGTRPFRPTDAGVAEAVISGVLLGGAVALVRHPLRGRLIALAALAFAILGVIAGLGFTVRGGDTIDVAYHATLLPVLLITLGAVSKRFPLHPHAPIAPSRA